MTKIFDGLGHIAIKVNDLDASLAFYEKLGFPEILRLLNDKGKPWIVYLRITDNTLLELFPGGTGAPVPGPEITGVNHLSLAVGDLDATEAALRSEGISLSRPRKEGPRRRRQSRHVDRGSRRQPHRDHGDGAGLHPEQGAGSYPRGQAARGAGALLSRGASSSP